VKLGEPQARASRPSTCVCQEFAHTLAKNDNCAKIIIFVGHTLENPAPIDNLGVILHGSHFCRTPASNPLHQEWLWGRDWGHWGHFESQSQGGALMETLSQSKSRVLKSAAHKNAHTRACAPRISTLGSNRRSRLQLQHKPCTEAPGTTRFTS